MVGRDNGEGGLERLIDRREAEQNRMGCAPGLQGNDAILAKPVHHDRIKLLGIEEIGGTLLDRLGNINDDDVPGIVRFFEVFSGIHIFQFDPRVVECTLTPLG